MTGPSLTHGQIIQLIQKYGFGSNAAMSLYEGFQFFTIPALNEHGAIAFYNTKSAWVGAADPLTSQSNLAAILSEFAKSANKNGKVAILVPTSTATAQVAKELGYRVIMVGSEPYFDLKRYPPSGNTWIDVVPTAKIFHQKGAKVSEFTPASLDGARKAELDKILQEWLNSRKISPLGFLNRVEPWILAKEKKYFVIEDEQGPISFIAALPIWARKGWYLIDVLRRTSTPVGSTELLILQSMRLLSEQGFEQVSLGIAPLSGLDQLAPEVADQKIHRFLQVVFEKGNQFYNFKTLEQFKQKFKPTSHEPAFLLFYPPRLRPKIAIGMLQAVLPNGILRTLISRLKRILVNIDIPALVKGLLSETTVVRSAPPSFSRLLLRCRLTSILTLALPLLAVFFNSILWNLWIGFILIFVFGGLLEYLSGSFIFGACLFTSSLVSSLPDFRFERLTLLSGIGCFFAVLPFLKHGKGLIVIFGLAIAYFCLNHGFTVTLIRILAAAFLGFLTARVMIRN